ncbi:MAG: hypothetical protein SNH13_00440 [Rikenellaceae bacterium]
MEWWRWVMKPASIIHLCRFNRLEQRLLNRCYNSKWELAPRPSA